MKWLLTTLSVYLWVLPDGVCASQVWPLRVSWMGWAHWYLPQLFLYDVDSWIRHILPPHNSRDFQGGERFEGLSLNIRQRLDAWATFYYSIPLLNYLSHLPYYKISDSLPDAFLGFFYLSYLYSRYFILFNSLLQSVFVSIISK